jgi:2,3-bisphosphoglycerate-dependent phosphoglycerate mutase
VTGAEARPLLVRHGESTWNRSGRVQGQTAHPRLTRRGRAQARALAATLVPLEVTRILTSDLRRATQTAAVLGRAVGITPEPTPLLRERHWGAWQGRSRRAAEEEARTLAPHERLAGGESVCDVRERVERLLRQLGHQIGVVVLVTHGDVIASLLGSEVPSNASVHRLPLAPWDTPAPCRHPGAGMCKGVPTS